MALPIEPVLPALAAALGARGAAVLQAPPGAGKTTRVPLALLDQPWLGGRKIVILEPRRLAARAAARRMAALLGEPVGGTVGCRIRLETRVTARTRIEVVTEGVLTRLLLEDPALEGVGLVIFDEFHERSIHADLGLALTLQTRELLRDDLRILVMSATLDGEPVARLLGAALGVDAAPVVTSEGRAFPVETRYFGAPGDPRRPGRRIEPSVAGAVLEALTREEGDVLVFLPGAGEIRRAETLLRERLAGDPAIDIYPLHGTLPAEQQDAAIRPSPPGRRKIVLATSIAETSLTIEGVRVVVDSGLARVPRFSPRTGMTRLETVRVSRAAAEQRRGRAGRVAPGVCYRLWAEGEQGHLLPHALPEILEADLAPLVLDLAAAGVTEPLELRWLDPPPPAAYRRARELLHELEAIDAHGRITPHGRRMAELGAHPRLAHMMLRGASLGAAGLACRLAALLGERDLLRPEAGPPDPDLRLRLELLRRLEGPARREAPVDREALRRIRLEAERWAGRLPAEPPGANRAEAPGAGLLLAFAYPDRIAARRPGPPPRYLLRNGTGAYLDPPGPLGSEPWLVVAETDGRSPEGRIRFAAPITLEEVEAHFGDQLEREEVVAWDDAAQAVVARRRERLGALVLREGPLPHPDPARVRGALLDAVARRGLELLPWTDAARRLRERLRFLHRLDPAWPDVSDDALLGRLAEWLGPWLDGVRRRDELARLDLVPALEGLLDRERRRALDRLAPTHWTVPSGSRIPIDYADPEAPALAVRLQEMFGASDTPRIADGRVPLTLHLLSPAHRPVQVTRDLAGFWRGAYFEVRKDLRGRYPKHHWPDDPLAAAPTRRTKR
ncbi:MAG TPA: ATP-dependent helicase HrpB [Gemmatimonadales bacterium]|nr:ATP-dependent helicase HrpB [Gemmatimonadales bacterium]